MSRGDPRATTPDLGADAADEVETLREAAERALLAHGPRSAWAIRLIALADQFEASPDLAQRNRYADEIRRVYAARGGPPSP